MSYHEAIEDNIKHYKDRNGDNHYLALCYICGQEVDRLCYKRDIKYICEKCKEDVKTKKDQENELINKYAAEKKITKAIKRIKNQGNNIEEYDPAIECIKKYINRKGWFQSTEEVLTGIQLLKSKIKFRHQVKMGRYKVDFILPDEKIVLEIDGALYHTEDKKEKEQLRDNLIIAHLGPEWEVIRIGDIYINQNIRKLVPAIRKIKEARKKERCLNNGGLTKNYSKRAL